MTVDHTTYTEYFRLPTNSTCFFTVERRDGIESLLLYPCGGEEGGSTARWCGVDCRAAQICMGAKDGRIIRMLTLMTRT